MRDHRDGSRRADPEPPQPTIAPRRARADNATNRAAAALVSLLVLGGCAPLSGASSLTVLSADRIDGLVAQPQVEEERDCANWLLTLFLWGRGSGHEALTERLLARTGADAIVDARVESSTWGFPYLFMRSCETVRGRPARRTAGAK